MLAHWARDRAHDRLPLEWVVRKMTSETASMYGLGDRGTLEPGKIGDVNVIDFDHVQVERPVMVHDLPGDARRFVQRARGYVTTVKSGETILCDGDDQGARPGRLLRGAR
jgi:N-acyl-D-aspartate/D-glutamate deacylase